MFDSYYEGYEYLRGKRERHHCVGVLGRGGAASGRRAVDEVAKPSSAGY